MSDLPLAVDVVLVAGAVATALSGLAVLGVKTFRAARAVDEHFRRRESERIEQAAGRLIDKAASALGSQLTELGDRIEGLDRRWREDNATRARQVGEWELWRAGVDSRLDMLDAGRRFPPLAGDRRGAEGR